jgi:hypothetical protein
MRRWFISMWCNLWHHQYWIGYPVHHSWDLECTKCGRKWTDYD